jgi:hypothetical protein
VLSVGGLDGLIAETGNAEGELSVIGIASRLAKMTGG